MKLFALSLLLFAAPGIYAQKSIPLYAGVAPGSERWNWTETEVKVDNNTYVFDVVKPSLLAYLPEHPNGTAIILAPGGAFHALALDLECTPLAKRLSAEGISVFVLKYRLVHDDPLQPDKALMKLIARNDTLRVDSIYQQIVPMALQDGLAAVAYIKKHAAEYRLKQGKIGFMGFSAGGTVAMSVIYNAGDESRPDFVGSVYTFPGPVIGSRIPTKRTPLFVACASDDEFGFTPANVQTYLQWVAAKQPTELHVYERGGHGFGMKVQHLPVDHWADRFEEWLKMEGYL